MCPTSKGTDETAKSMQTAGGPRSINLLPIFTGNEIMIQSHPIHPNNVPLVYIGLVGIKMTALLCLYINGNIRPLKFEQNGFTTD